MMLSRRLMMAGKSQETYTWIFDAFLGLKNTTIISIASESPNNAVYPSGTTLPDIFTSTYTPAAGQLIGVNISLGVTGVPGTSTGSRPWAGFNITDNDYTYIARDTWPNFYTAYPFKPGAIIKVRNVTDGVDLHPAWSGTDSDANGLFSSAAASYNGVAGHYFYPNNQTPADGATNGWDAFTFTPLTTGQTKKIHLTITA
jgi:hypothetical protein